MPARAPRLVLGFTPEVARYMRLADFFVGKPGPGSVSEAVQMNLPVIVVRNRTTMPQERYNAQWIHEHGVGLVLPGFAGIAGAVDDLIRDLDRYRAATLAVRNRAAFEVPRILQDILRRSERTPGSGVRAAAKPYFLPIPSAGLGALPARTFSSIRLPVSGSMLFQ